MNAFIYWVRMDPPPPMILVYQLNLLDIQCCIWSCLVLYYLYSTPYPAYIMQGHPPPHTHLGCVVFAQSLPNIKARTASTKNLRLSLTESLSEARNRPLACKTGAKPDLLKNHKKPRVRRKTERNLESNRTRKIGSNPVE